MRAAVLKVSATLRNSVTVNKALSVSSATTLDDLGTCTMSQSFSLETAAGLKTS